MSNKPSERPKTRFSLRTMIDYIMGGIIGLLGLFFLLRGQFPGLAVNNHLGEPDRTDWMFGALCLIYSTWRIIRARRKSVEA